MMGVTAGSEMPHVPLREMVNKKIIQMQSSEVRCSVSRPPAATSSAASTTWLTHTSQVLYAAIDILS